MTESRKIMLCELIATAIDARARCIKTGNDYYKQWNEILEQCRFFLPSGSGFDNGTKIADESTADKLIFETAFHHMNHGCYDGWTEHRVVVRPSFIGTMTISSVSGPNRHDIKDYIAETFQAALSQYVEWTRDGVRALLTKQAS